MRSVHSWIWLCPFFNFVLIGHFASAGTVSLADEARTLEAEIRELSDAAKRVCEGHLGQDKVAFALIHAKVARLTGSPNRTARPINVSEVSVKQFWTKGWPEIRRLAAANGMTAVEFVRYYAYTIFEIEDSLFATHLVGLKSHCTEGVLAVRKLEKWDVNAKLRKEDWRIVRFIYDFLVGLAVAAIRLEEISGESKPSFDPLHPLSSADQVRSIFESLDASTLDRGDRIVYSILNAREKGNRQNMSVDDPYGRRYSPEEFQPSAPESTDKIAQTEATPVVLPELLPDLGVEALDLADAMRADRGLSEEHKYIVRPVSRHIPPELEVRVSRRLARQSDKHWVAIKKLLSSIHLGDGGISGVKKLFDTAPDLIELKVIMHSHKRVLGCLKGNMLYLKELVELPEDRASYFKRILKDYCSGYQVPF